MLRLKNATEAKLENGKYILEYEVNDTTKTVNSRLEYYIAPYFS